MLATYSNFKEDCLVCGAALEQTGDTVDALMRPPHLQSFVGLHIIIICNAYLSKYMYSCKIITSGFPLQEGMMPPEL